MSYIVLLFVREIKAGNITLDDVPAGLKSKVEAALAENEQQSPTTGGEEYES